MIKCLLGARYRFLVDAVPPLYAAGPNAVEMQVSE